MSSSTPKLRSPSYPIFGLSEALQHIKTLFETCQDRPIDRNDAFRVLGFKTGRTGRSVQVLASLGQFGLLQKAGKGQVAVSQLAVDVLYGETPEDRMRALRTALESPPLFSDLLHQFPGQSPEPTVLHGYLMRNRFTPKAAEAAIRAYLATINDIKAVGSAGGPEPDYERYDEPAVITLPSPTSKVIEGTALTPAETEEATMQTVQQSGEFTQYMAFPAAGTMIRISANGPVGPEQLRILDEYLQVQKRTLDREESRSS